MRLGPDLIYGPNPVITRSLPRNTKLDDSTFPKAFQDLCQIIPEVFEEAFLDDLGSKTPAQNKGKGVSGKKNTIELVIRTR